jgi:1,2-phenylacetyl-CoA epoxidase PaaB subunit
MTPGGWIILILSVGSVTTLFAWCIWKVFQAPESQQPHLHGFEIQTPDEKEL